jgi:hypothetical protein
MKTPSKTPPNLKDYAPKLPPGAHVVPNSRTVKALKGERERPVKFIDKSFVSDPRGGPELVAPGGVHVKDNRTIDKR